MATEELDFEALRRAIEHCDLDAMRGFYAEDAQLCILNADAPHASPFELRGKAQIAKHLRTVFSKHTSHRVEREVVGKNQVTFREACEYPDGGRAWVETTLEVHEGNIDRQVDVVTRDARDDNEDEISHRRPTRNIHPETHPGMHALTPDSLLRSEHATEKEDL